MRSYSLSAVLGISLLVVFGMQLLTLPAVASSIEASVEIKPETLNLKENGVITVFVELPSPYNASDIDVGTIRLRVEGGEDYVVPIRCVFADGKLVAKFDASEVADYILGKLVHMQVIPPQPKYRIDLVVEGMVKDVHFEDDDQIRIILP